MKNKEEITIDGTDEALKFLQILQENLQQDNFSYTFNKKGDLYFDFKDRKNCQPGLMLSTDAVKTFIRLGAEKAISFIDEDKKKPKTRKNKNAK